MADSENRTAADGRPRKRRRWVAVAAVALLLALAGGVALKLMPDGGIPAVSAPTLEGPALAPYCGRQLGNADAPVQITALLPVYTGCQDDIGRLAIDAAERFPNVFAATVYDMKSPEAQAIMREHGIRCACVVVNGQTRFDLGPESGGRLLLEGPMEVLDLHAVLVAESRRARGAAAPDLGPPPEPRETHRTP